MKLKELSFYMGDGKGHDPRIKIVHAVEGGVHEIIDISAYKSNLELREVTALAASIVEHAKGAK